jgi:L-arabinose isomerase
MPSPARQSPGHHPQPAPVAALDYKAFNMMGDRTRMTGAWLAHCGACPVPEIANAFKHEDVMSSVMLGK